MATANAEISSASESGPSNEAVIEANTQVSAAPSALDKVKAMLGQMIRVQISDGRVIEGEFQVSLGHLV